MPILFYINKEEFQNCYPFIYDDPMSQEFKKVAGNVGKKLSMFNPQFSYPSTLACYRITEYLPHMLYKKWTK